MTFGSALSVLASLVSPGVRVVTLPSRCALSWYSAFWHMKIVRETSSRMSLPTTVAPWLFSSTAAWGPSLRASDSPSSGLTTSRLVSPNSSCWFQNGTVSPPAAPKWNTGTIGTPAMQNGSTAGEWWCTTAVTSGRAA